MWRADIVQNIAEGGAFESGSADDVSVSASCVCHSVHTPQRRQSFYVLLCYYQVHMLIQKELLV